MSQTSSIRNLKTSFQKKRHTFQKQRRALQARTIRKSEENNYSHNFTGCNSKFMDDKKSIINLTNFDTIFTFDDECIKMNDDANSKTNFSQKLRIFSL